MSYLSRKNLYQELEKIRKRPLISYVTSIRPGCSGQMGLEVLPILIKQLNQLDSSSESVDFLIISNGGDPIVSWRIISLLREKFKYVSILIPYTAYSAATLLALGADEIIMHPFGNLGPLDPQLGFVDSHGNQRMISYEDITKYIEFIKDTGITDQDLLQKSFEKLTLEIPPTTLGFAKRSSQLGLTMGEKLLATHMKDENKRKVITETLNTKFYHHGYPLARNEAKEIGLPIAKSNKKVEDIIWKIYEDFMEEMEFNKYYNPQAMIMEKITSNNMPVPNTINFIKEKTKVACLESLQLNCYVEEELVATYMMLPDTTLNNNLIINQGNWIIEGGKSDEQSNS